MFQEENRKNAYVTVWFLFSIFLCFAVFDIIHRFVPTGREDERSRATDVRPRLSVENVGDGYFASAYSRYVDKYFVGKENLASVANFAELMTNRRVIQDVYVTEDGYYIERHLPTHYTAERMDEKLAQMKKLLEDYPDADILLIPSQDSVMRDKLPWSAPYVEEEVLLQRAKAHLGEEHVVDVFPTFDEMKDKELYLATDSRINSMGAYYVYREWTAYMGEKAVWYRLDDMTTVTQDYEGRLVQAVAFVDKKENLDVFTQTLQTDVIVSYDYEKVSGSFYEASKLSGDEPYDYFLDGKHRLTVIDTQTKNDKVLFVVKDQSANVVLPLMAPHYARIYAVDIDFFDAQRKEFMDSCNIFGQMDVLVLCGMDTFMDNFTY